MKVATTFVFSSLIGLSAAQQVANADLNVLGGKHLVDREKLVSSVSESALLGHAHKFVEFSKFSNGTRAFGTAGYNATIDYIQEKLLTTGYYNVELHSLPYLLSSGNSTLSVNGTSYAANWFEYDPASEVQAPLVLVNNLGCNSTDYTPAVAGKIALITRGTCQYGLKSALAGAAGAKGAIIVNNISGDFSGGSLGKPRPVGPYVPTVGISDTNGKILLDAIMSGAEVIGKVQVVTVNEDRWSSNLVATSKCGDQNNVVMAGAHSDSVLAGPGINDNGSGTMGILEVALQLANFETKQAVRFGFWTAEEYGLVGSEHYVKGLSAEQNQKIAMYLNFDMIASPNYGYFIYDGDGSQFNVTGPPGSDKIERTFQEYFKSINVKGGSSAFDGRSDYGPFLEAGIPSGGLDTGAEGNKTAEEVTWWGGQAGIPYDKCYHQACDGFDNLAVDAFVKNAKGIAYAIATYAVSIDDIPRTRNATAAAKFATTFNQADSHSSGCGHKLDAL